MSIYYIIYIVIAILLLIICNSYIYINQQKEYDTNKIIYNNDEYIAASIYPLLWPGFIIAIIITFGCQFLWKYILFPIFTFPGRLYLRKK